MLRSDKPAKPKAALERLRTRASHTSGWIARSLRVFGREKPRQRPQIRVIRDSTLRRKWSLEDLRGSANGFLDAYGTTVTGGLDDPVCGGDVASDGVPSPLKSDSMPRAYPDHVEPFGGELVSNGVLQQTQSDGSHIFAPRPTKRERPRGMVIDVAVPAARHEFDTAVSPGTTKPPFIPPRPPTPWPSERRVGEDQDGISCKDLQMPPPAMPVLSRESTTSSSDGPQERFDSYVDAIEISEARACTVRAFTPRDIIKLEAETECVDSGGRRTTWQEVGRGASPAGPESRPRSWHCSTQAVGSACEVGAHGDCEMEPKRQTWHVDDGEAWSSTHEDGWKEVMEGHVAGARLFRLSIYRNQVGRFQDIDHQAEDWPFPPSAPRVDVCRTFDFRRECERVARRIRPTFPVSRS